jgi:hypothetical protein
MPASSEAVADLEAASDAISAQLISNPGNADLINAQYNIQAEIDAIETNLLNNAPYVPQTDPFKAVTAQAKGFVTTLTNIKTAFKAAAGLAGLIDKVIGYIK